MSIHNTPPLSSMVLYLLRYARIYFVSPSQKHIGTRRSYGDSFRRPGYTALKKVCISLLLTCRKVYLETYHQPILNKEWVFWEPKGPDGRYNLLARWLRRRLRPELRPLVKELHLFTQQSWLEGSFYDDIRHMPFKNIERLKITICHDDWDSWTTSGPMRFEPQYKVRHAQYAQEPRARSG
jgi:hypothetical protein